MWSAPPRGPFPKWSSPECPRPLTPDLRPQGNLPRSARHADRPPRVRRARTPAGAVAGRLLAGRATRRVRRPDLLHESAQSGEPQHGGVPREYQEAGTRLRARARGLRPPGRGDLALLLARAGTAPRRLRLLAAVATLRGRVARGVRDAAGHPRGREARERVEREVADAQAADVRAVDGLMERYAWITDK